MFSICLGCSNPNAVSVSVNFEGASAENITVVSADEIRFSLRPDPVGQERLWFYFRVNSPTPISPQFILDNPSDAHFGNWDVVRPVFSTDGKNWVRAVDTGLGWDDSILSKLKAKIRGDKPVFRFRSPVVAKQLWVAYSYPYTSVDLKHFLDTIRSDKRVQFSTIGRSEDGREIELVTIDDSSAATSTTRQEIWIVCREHPGETPASFVMEGVVKAVLDRAVGGKLLAKYRVHIVPILNVDGMINGNYYRNTKGIDLAQDWGSFKSAEVRALFEAMRGGLESEHVALFFNLHSANYPENHFFLKMPEGRLPANLLDLQRKLIQASVGIHPQLQVNKSVEFWDYPEIQANYLNTKYGVYCFTSESNYNVGANGSVVTPASLRKLGAAFVGVLSTVLVDSI
ncbi:MAG: hypothetical protein AMJ56_06485 [Anaerolineae bacterium SG8_19]|nr:MAG: hypothetical protein AMJ56_06485 [Anaerolineae bacterium SG8_19]